MAFNVKTIFKNGAKLITLAKKYKSNPKGAINEALTMLEKVDKNSAQYLRSELNNGKKPIEIIKEQAQKGNINSQDLKTIKSAYSMFANDIPEKVPNKVWNDVDNAIKSNGTGNNGNSVFSGF